MSDAEAYAAQNNLRVNAVRVWAEKVRVIRDGWTGSYPAKVLGAAGDENGTLAEFNASGETDEWREYDSGGDSEVPVSGRGVVIVPGFLRVDTGVTDGDIYPGGTTTLVLKPITWNNDTNAKITVTIPKGLSLKSGSIKQNGSALAANNYTATKNDDGTTAVEITGSPIAGEEPTETLDATGLISDVQAADNGGKGVEHSPITMELVADEDATTPSSVALQVESSGMGTNRTVEAFRKKSLSISLATPPKTFSYGMASSAATLYPTEDLDYTLTAGNSTDNSTDDGGIDTVNVLPYDGDSRGTTNLKSYLVKSFSLSSVNVDNVRLYYTTDMTVRDMDKVSGSDATAASGVLKIADDDGQAKWTECTLVDGVCNLPDGAAATAVRIKTGAMASGGNLKLKYTLSNILPVDSTKSGAINNDLAYMAASGAIDPAAHVGNANTDYSGNVVGLSLSSDDGAVDKDGALTISKQLDVNSLVKATIKADVAAATLSGTDFTVNVPTEMAGAHEGGGEKVKLKALSDGLSPVAGTPGYSLQLDGGTWSASQAKFISPGNARQTLLTVFAAGSSTATPADAYTGKITFTIAARQ